MKLFNALLALPALSLAFPGMIGVGSKEAALRALRENRAEELSTSHDKRQLLGSLLGSNGVVGGLVGTLLNDVKGLLGSVASSISPDNYRPEPGYTFQAPGPGDSRGPCPGLNLLANYGYLPRDGYVNYGQVVEATA
jgi:hypothetical protein